MERKNDMVTDEELYGQYLCGDETGLELLIKKYGDPLTSIKQRVTWHYATKADGGLSSVLTT